MTSISTIVGSCLILAAAAGCSSSNTAATSAQNATAPSSHEPRLTVGINIQMPRDTGQPALLRIRNLFVLGPKDGQTLAPGANAAVYAEIVNVASDGRPDQLVAVSSPRFTGPTKIEGGAIGLPHGVRTSLNSGSAPRVVLTGLTELLRGGEKISLALTFQRAGSTTVTVPIVKQRGDFATYPAAPSATPAPTG